MAHADEVPQYSERSGLTGGGALTLGNLGCDTSECDEVVEAGGLSAHIGGMLSPRLALVADLWGMSHRDGRATFSQSIMTCAVRWWPTDIIWLSGGVGVARASFQYDGDFVEFRDRTESVPGIMLAAGVEVLRGPSYALEVQVRGGTGYYEEDQRIRNYALGLGASFY